MDNQFLHIEPKKDTTLTHKRQIERGAISKAIYMVTDLFEVEEPLRIALRKMAVDIVADASQKHVETLKELLRLSSEIGLISDKNISVLVEAIDYMKVDSSSVQVKDIHIEDLLQRDVSKSSVDDVPKDKNNTQSLPIRHVHQDIATESTHQLEKLQKLQKVQTPKPVVSTVTTLDIGSRRKKILEVVKSKGQATIHEFIQNIQGCSSKTIQRELTSLVLSGTLKKTGERRWSKYSLR